MESGNPLLDDYVLGLGRNPERPRVCFLPSASGDADHYQPGSERRFAYHDFIRAGMRCGYAAEDGAALHFVGTELSRVVASWPDARGYRLDPLGDRVVEMRIATTYLGDARIDPPGPVPEAISTAAAA
jgi:hypothetical protein